MPLPAAPGYDEEGYMCQLDAIQQAVETAMIKHNLAQPLPPPPPFPMRLQPPAHFISAREKAAFPHYKLQAWEAGIRRYHRWIAQELQQSIHVDNGACLVCEVEQWAQDPTVPHIDLYAYAVQAYVNLAKAYGMDTPPVPWDTFPCA
jgi:hypothetical protein